MTLALDFGGNDLVVNTITTGATSPGTAPSGSAPIALSAGTTLKSNVVATTATGNAATVTNYLLQVTTPSLATAAAGSQAEVLTLAGITASDIAFVQYAGGTNTTRNITLSAVCSTNTVTVTIYNTDAAALNGTVIFTVWVLKA